MNKYLQFIFDKTIDGVLFKRMSFYCLVSIETRVVSCSDCKGDNKYKGKEFYKFKVTINGEEREFEVSEDYAYTTNDCPDEKYMDIDNFIYERRNDMTGDVMKAVERATGHDMKEGWFGQEAYTINDVMGIKHGSYGGTPIDNSQAKGDVKKEKKGKNLR